MKYLIIGVTIFILVLIYALNFIEVESVESLTLNQEETVYVGQGEVCESPYIKAECLSGLECVRVEGPDSSGYENKQCVRVEYN